jgi:glycosyltransferase involved in cell wall biosynthesis
MPTILHVFSGDLWAGAEVAIFNLLNRLRDGADSRHVALALNEGVLTNRLRRLGIETHVIPEATASFAGICRSAHRLLEGRTIDIVHSHRYKENLLAAAIGASLGIPRLVSTIHGRPERRGSARTRIAAWLDDLVLRRRFDRVVAVSADMKQILTGQRRFTASRVAVIRNGVPVPALAARPAGSTAVLQVGSVGRLVPVKRFDLFLEVAARIRRATGGVRFSLLGDGPLRPDLLARAAALDLDGCFALLPPRPDPLAYYQSLDVYLNTSLHEGLPLSVLEAMACGTPVVAARVGGMPEVVGDGVSGLLIDDSAPESFANACLRLLAAADLRSAMGQQGRRRVEAEFSDTQMADAYRQLYLELGGSRSVPVAEVLRRDPDAVVP